MGCLPNRYSDEVLAASKFIQLSDFNPAADGECSKANNFIIHKCRMSRAVVVGFDVRDKRKFRLHANYLSRGRATAREEKKKSRCGR